MPRRPTGRPPGRPRHPEPLTPAEQRVLHLLREKLPNAEIGVRLGVSPDAVKYHVSNMLGKLQLENREQLAAWREPSGLRRVWASIPALGLKLALVGGAVAAGVVAVAIVWGLTRDEVEEPTRFDPEALATGVLTIGVDGEPGNGQSSAPSISADGRFIAFESDATNLVSDDTNDARDIFLLDRLTNETRRISMGMGGDEPNGPSFRPSISADGKWVAFDSQASNLVKDDENGDLDRALPFVPDNMRESLRPAPTDNGRTLAGQAPHWAGSDVFVVELTSGKTEIASVTSSGERGNLGSFVPSISGDGRFVAFESIAPNLRGRAVAGGGPPAGYGSIAGEAVFLRDREAKKTIYVSKASEPDVEERMFGSALATVSRDGRFVAFASREARLVSGVPLITAEGRPAMGGIYIWTRETEVLQAVPFPASPDGGPLLNTDFASKPAISVDGRFLAFGASLLIPPSAPGSSTGSRGIWLFQVGDLAAEWLPGTERAIGGPQPLSFNSSATVLMTSATDPARPSNTFEGGTSYDVATKQPTPVVLPPGLEGSWLPIISADGKWIVATKLGEIVVFPR